ncbi:hypothetical protein SSX86_001027 [Deinandra increscens subsp. villosa]|uniref:3'-5' exonuclease domain-containing protein n=1 Tax=Deinandra increscens subsp. villosa TaxID=3103831 RepID=A0AAP0DQY2_9ASTR
MAVNLQMLNRHERDGVAEYLMQIDDASVETLVTHCPIKVEEWIRVTYDRNLPRLHRLIVAVDVLWPPATTTDDAAAPAQENPVAILLFLVNTRCLMYQIQRSYRIPDDLKDFMACNYTFVAIGVENYMEKLDRDLDLGVVNAMDLREIAARELVKPELEHAMLHQLAERFLGKVVDAVKLVEVRMSDWDSVRLSDEQVLYASLHAYYSFCIARMLHSWYD